jgi:alkanesulfonate monooxygenase SsuD/methylene tetrahydromethanopterin reductase-like flavin-dependent oxidoreductase (luciferase family)
MTVPIGFMLFTNQSLPTTVKQIQLGEELGYNSAWLLDSQLVGRELFVTMAASAVATNKIRIGPGVTHSATRHASVLASGFASLAELAPGRIDLALGYGDSAIRGLGGKPVRLEQHRRDFMMIRDLLAGREVEIPDNPNIRLAWADAALTRQIPLYSVPGNGPKSTRLAGELGEGVVLYTEEEELGGHLEWLAEGARLAGKRPEDVPIIWWAKASLSDEWDAVKEHLAPRLASGIRHKYYDYKRGSRQAEDVGIPIDLARRVAEEYNFLEHATADVHHGHLLDEIPAHVWKQGILAGTPEEAAETINRVVSTYPQIREVVLHFPVATKRVTIESMLELFATRSVPHLRQAVA